MRIFAIDPGLSGAWALIDDGVAVRVGDMPVAGEGTRRKVSAAVLAFRLQEFKPDLLVSEMASAMPADLHGRKQGNSSTFRYGVAYGTVLGVAGAVGVPVETVVPVVWKRHHRLLGLPKEASRARALQVAPAMASMLDRKMDHGRAEAILIGLYGWATWGARLPPSLGAAA